MRQVPETDATYLVIGDGRLAKHFIRYFTLLSIPFQRYTRNSPEPFSTHQFACNRILVLINDKEIVRFIQKHKVDSSEDALWIHCSGLISTELAESAHPLASFSDHLFDLEFYKSIPFVLEKGRKCFSEILPGLPNPNLEIDKADKALYHTMCVVAGNFGTILWLEFEKFLSEKLQTQKSAMFPYLDSVRQNLEHAKDPLTGPLKRNDHETMERHLKSLEGSPLKEIYTSFVNLYAKQKQS